jgi:hypothetical protein
MHRSSSRTLGAVVSWVGVPLLIATLALISLMPGPAAAAEDVPWAVATASNSFGSDRANYSYTINPGGQLKDGLVVDNRGTTSLDLAVYAADGYTTKTGQLDLAAAGASQRGVGAWVHADRDRVTVRPGQKVEIPFTLDVPADAAPGDHVGGIVTSLTEVGSAGEVDHRLALRISLRVSGARRPQLSVEHVNLDYAGTANPFGKGDAVLSYTIHNTGNSVTAARSEASVSGPFDRWKVDAGHIEDSPELLPGERWQVTVPVHGVTPALRLTAHVSLVPLVTDAAGSTFPLDTVDARTHAWTIPWTALALVVACLLLMALAARRRRRRTGLPTAVPVEDTAPPARVPGRV